MKNQTGVILLTIVCLALAIFLVVTKKNASEEKKNDTETIVTLSNKWVDTSSKLEEQKQVSAMLEKDLDTTKKNLLKSIDDLTNNFTQATTSLAQREAQLKASQDNVAKLEAKNNELEAQNQALDKQAVDLSTAITNLTTQISDTERKLTASEGDRAFLQKELKRLMAEKAELERQFNDLAVLRAQVSKLKEELSIARRIEWIRQGIFAASEEKGAQRLMQGANAQKPAAAVRTNYDLNVEVKSDGSVRVIPPLTNAPAKTP